MKRLTIILITAALLFTSCASSGRWADDPYRSYSQKKYICALGYGDDMKSAELDAKNELIQLFALEMTSTSTRSVYDAQRDGASSYGELFTTDVTANSRAEELYGVQIREREQDRKTGECRALAVLDRDDAAMHYRQLIESEKEQVGKLRSEVQSGIGLFSNIAKAGQYRELVERYNLHVATYNYLADRKVDLASLAEAERLESDSRSSIIVSIRVEGDVDGSIKAAIARTFTEIGFRVSDSGANAEAVINVSWRDSENEQFRFANYVADVSVREISTDRTILVYTAREREGHMTKEGAVSRATRAIARNFDIKLKEALK